MCGRWNRGRRGHTNGDQSAATCSTRPQRRELCSARFFDLLESVTVATVVVVVPTIASRSAMQSAGGPGQIDAILEDIGKREAAHESRGRQQDLRIRSDAAEISRLKAELEAASAAQMDIQKQNGRLSREKDDLAGEIAKLREERRDFQRSMANNEDRLKQNDQDAQRAKRAYTAETDASNAFTSRMWGAMIMQAGGNSAGYFNVPTPRELDALRATAASALEDRSRAAELEARLHAVEAKTQGVQAESDRRQRFSQREIASLKSALVTQDGGTMADGSNQAGRRRRRGDGDDTVGDKDMHKQQHQLRQAQKELKRIPLLEKEVARLNEMCKTQLDYINRLEDYADTVEATNNHLKNLQPAANGGGDEGGDNGVIRDEDQATHGMHPAGQAEGAPVT